MESWVVGYDGDSDVERHSGATDSPLPPTGDLSAEVEGPGVEARPTLRIREISDYI